MTFDPYTNERPWGLLKPGEKTALVNAAPLEVYTHSGWVAPEGVMWFSATGVYRAVRPAAVPDTIDWSHVAPHLVCGARDDVGAAWLYEHKPYPGKDMWCRDVYGASVPAALFASYKPGNLPWDQSLFWRPGHGPGKE